MTVLKEFLQTAVAFGIQARFDTALHMICYVLTTYLRLPLMQLYCYIWSMLMILFYLAYPSNLQEKSNWLAIQLSRKIVDIEFNRRLPTVALSVITSNSKPTR